MNQVAEIGRSVAVVPIDRTHTGYIAREFAQCPFPHTDPKGLQQLERRDGDFSMRIIADPKYGLPYGPLAKLLVVWVTTAAKNSKTPDLDLGDSISQFLDAIGLDIATGGGKRGDLKRVRNQLCRLLNCMISFDYEANDNGPVDAWSKMLVAENALLWWDVNKPKHTRYLFNSKITLSQKFYDAVQEHAVPINVTMAARLTRSPLALDVFVWSCYRLARMKQGEKVYISYDDLHKQFGTDIKDLKNFRTKLGQARAIIARVWPQVPISLEPRGFLLTGINPSNWPVLPDLRRSGLRSRPSTNPFELSAPDMLALENETKGWSIHALRQNWEAWCKESGQTPTHPKAHFRSFVRAHIKRNGPGR